MSIDSQQILNWIIQALISFLFGGAGAFVAIWVSRKLERDKEARLQVGRKTQPSNGRPVPPASLSSPTGPAGEFASQPPAGSFGLVCVSQGAQLGRLYLIEDGQSIGRTDSDLVLDDPKVSGVHARLTLESGGCNLSDNGSTNGTWVNNQRLRKSTRLQENDLIKIGDTVFIFKSF